METLINYLTDHPFLGIIITIIGISFLVGVIKSLFKMAMTIAVIGLVMVVFFNFKPQEVMDSGKNIAQVGSKLFENNQLLSDLSNKDFFIKKEDGKTFIEIESLGIKYNVENFLPQSGEEEQPDKSDN